MAFKIAARWARRDLPHISQCVIDHAEAVVMAGLEPELQQTGPMGDPQVSVQAKKKASRSKTVSFQTQTDAPPKKRKNKSVATMTDRGPSDWSPEEEEQEEKRGNRRGGIALGTKEKRRKKNGWDHFEPTPQGIGWEQLKQQQIC